MQNHPVYIIFVLLLIETAILWLDRTALGEKLFRFLPSMFWIYFLPMLVNTAGLLPAENPLYTQITRWVLPAALVTLLLSADIRGILRLGPKALGMMTAAVAGIVVGAPIVTFLYHRWLPEEAWKGIGALSASWIGGSANMIAVKEAINTPDRVFLPAVIVDTLVPYFWMALLIAASTYQSAFDRWNRSDTHMLDELAVRTATHQAKHRWTIAGICFIVILAVFGSFMAVFIGHLLPTAGNVFSATAWAIVLATLLGVLLSLTPARQLESYNSGIIGFAMLYFVLASIGSRTNLSQVRDVPVLLAAGLTWILIHAAFLLIAARLFRAPLALVAAASQASIGGPASAPVVAGIYRPQLAPVGLLLAVLGNILGTFLGLLAARLCQWVW